MMERWNTGILGLYCIALKNIMIHEIEITLMLRPAPHFRYPIAVILAAHWIQFVRQYKRWIRTVVFENVRKVLACCTAVLGCHIYRCKGCGHVELSPHSCRSRFGSTELVAGCPT